MNTTLLFDFTVNKEKNSIHVEREFAADLDLVWDAWTKSELLDQWWAPKPFRAVTKSMDFRVGGTWLYYMLSPKDEKFWCRVDYNKIEPKRSYAAKDGFCDENGHLNPEFPRSQWNNVFRAGTETTIVSISIQYEKLADLEKIISMGFKEGLTMCLENLDQYIEAQFKLRAENRKDTKARVTTYLNFAGNTEEAFKFYRGVFKTEFVGNGIQRFGDIPAGGDNPPVADSVKHMVLHVELPITGGHILMGTDAPKEMGFNLTRGNNMHINVEPETREEAKRLFDALAVGGTVNMPLQDMFFGAYFGELTDKYGINWMITHQNNQ
ncbi:MAG TPA: SRPBCC domain-containing protein [Puia sp.]|nr:SRPBCC domain-containing protein [Puia sp.]